MPSPSAKPSRSAATGQPSRLAARLAGDRARFVVFCLFVGCVFAMGGGSRADISSLVLLRPIAFLVASYALLVARAGELRAAAWPLGLLGCLAAIIGVQLIPLPPETWSALPGRQLYVQIARDAGLPLVWRPLTLSPSRSLNALFSLSVPLATVLITTVQSAASCRRLLLVLAIACGVSALVATAQIASSGNAALYLYRVTNPGFPVGLFANRNHQAVLMVILLVLIAYQIRLLGPRTRSGPLVRGGALVVGLVIMTLVLVAGSRAGLLLTGLALPTVAWLLTRPDGEDRKSGSARRTLLWAGGAVGVVLCLSAIYLGLTRAVSLERLFTADPLSDYRVARLPLVVDMLRDHWQLGAGFGAFEGLFLRYETVDLLTPFIFNQAHSDWLQFPLEGGLAAAVLLLFVLARVVLAAPRIIGDAHRGKVGARVVALLVIAMIALASVVDYPLRTPIFMLVATVSFMLATRAEPDGRT